MKVGLVVHAGRPASREVAVEAARTLAELDIEVVATVGGDVADDELPGELAHLAPMADPADFAAEIELAISLGGDGTFLRAAHLCRDAGVPVLGVNLGRLGFLAEVERHDLGPVLRAVAAGDYRIEERATLTMEVHDADGGFLSSDWALNEVAVEKTVRQRLLLVDVYFDGTFFARVPADALILATATGSTAYALSAGGPIVSPQVAATLVVPVAPHSLFDRTVVAGPEEVVRVELLEGQASGLASCDGRSPVALGPGATVTVIGGAEPVRLARVGLIDFPTLVRRKFGLR
ncbi:MAG: NAD(+)/NADH kinase [Nitriliruptoraceae bacterium]